ncbi:endonuclease domain-containing protein [Pelagibius sp.]|uniref:endonuclease domain-containing protein n=1 Tax=Pelagibius sp. TaxID=1931238 RepID=UPI00263494B2|nr:endonuclease domain-containing protein [Pelagibius sp.]
MSNARRLRRNETEAERRLWAALRNRQLAGHKFRRQVPLGRFVVDFACYDEKLVVELDGGQHSGGQHVDHQEKDAARTKWLEARGFRVLRFWNHEVLENLEGVLAKIAEALEESGSPSPSSG